MKNTKIGASSVVRPEELESTISKLTNRIISDKYKYVSDREDLFNEGFCAAWEYVSENPSKRSVVALIYKRIFGALADFVNKNSSPVKITKNNESRKCLYQNSSISDEINSDGEILVRNAKMNIGLNLDIIENLADPFESPENSFLKKEDEKQNREILDGILDFANQRFNSRDIKIFEMRLLNGKKLKDVSKELNISTQRISKLEKNICGSLNLEFGARFQNMICNN
ncbi:sigma-70 family RNA polymerase sigma factor [Alphaproteobacteria bacterium]|nr:sigma-70 family RNA polymerase sigma factor [Alphaproteobacteria bacterium]